jgi:hypothetical protein
LCYYCYYYYYCCYSHYYYYYYYCYYYYCCDYYCYYYCYYDSSARPQQLVFLRSTVAISGIQTSQEQPGAARSSQDQPRKLKMSTAYARERRGTPEVDIWCWNGAHA